MDFKKSLLTVLLLAASSSVFAAPKADLAVTGKIVPTSCDVSFANGGVVEHGHILAGTLSADVLTVLPYKPMSWNITCTAPTAIALSYTDNKAEGPWNTPSGLHFGIGKDSKDVPIGRLYMALGAGEPVRVTGGSAGAGGVAAVISSPDKTAWAANAAGAASKQAFMSFAPAGTTTPAAYSTYSGSFTLATSIAPTSELDVSGVIDVSGSVTMEVEYI